MSMNLHAKTVSGSIELWQTPTQITYTICVDENGIAGELKGKAAKRAMQAYKQWVLGSLNGRWTSIKDIEEHKQSIKEHILEIDKRMLERGLVVYFS